MIRNRIASLLLALAALPAAGAAASPDDPRAWWGTVSHVVDGDSLWIRPEGGRGKPRRVRLDGIDAPEICQPRGPQARDALARRVLKQRVRVSVRAHDGYGRALATVWLPDGRADLDLGEWMAAQGWAWSPGFRRTPGRYAEASERAQAQRLGLFGDERPQPPADFRHAHGPCR